MQSFATIKITLRFEILYLFSSLEIPKVIGPALQPRLIRASSQIQIMKRGRISVRYRRCRVPFLSFPLLALLLYFLSPISTLSSCLEGRRAEATTDDRSLPHPRFFLPLFAMETARTFAAPKAALFVGRTGYFSKSFYDVLVYTYPTGKHAARWR